MSAEDGIVVSDVLLWLVFGVFLAMIFLAFTVPDAVTPIFSAFASLMMRFVERVIMPIIEFILGV